MSFNTQMFSVLLVLFAAGCSESAGFSGMVPVTGTVTYDGQPLDHGVVTFDPIDPKAGQPANGQITEEGEFKMVTTSTDAGVIAGTYRVRIECREDVKKPDLSKPYIPVTPHSLIPEKYSDFKKSGIQIEVKSGMEPLKFDLKP